MTSTSTFATQVDVCGKLGKPGLSRRNFRHAPSPPNRDPIDRYDGQAIRPQPPTLAQNMRFPPQFLDELRARLPVSEVVGRRVKLRKTGREYVGLSPFNKEKSPSFTVNDQKGFFHDFSSGKHGDIFGFVMETEGVAFPGGRRAARADGRRADAEILQGGRGARREAQDPARRHGACGEVLRGDAGGARAAPRRAAISPTGRWIRRRS